MGRFGAHQVHVPTAIINYVEKGNDSCHSTKFGQFCDGKLVRVAGVSPS